MKKVVGPYATPSHPETVSSRLGDIARTARPIPIDNHKNEYFALNWRRRIMVTMNTRIEMVTTATNA